MNLISIAVGVGACAVILAISVAALVRAGAIRPTRLRWYRRWRARRYERGRGWIE